MNLTRRIQRHLAKAMAAGVVLVGAALPLAETGTAGATTGPTVNSSQTYLFGATAVITLTSSSTAVTFSNLPTGFSVAAGDLVVATNVPAGDTLASATTLTTATSASTAGNYVVNIYTKSSTVGASSGNTGEIVLTGSGFASESSSSGASVASTAPGTTFSNVSETGTTVLATFTLGAAAAAGNYSVSVSDTNGTSNALADALLLTTAPTVTAVSPASAIENSSPSLTISGSGFENSTSTTAVPSVTLTSTVDGSNPTVSNVAWVNTGTLTFNASLAGATAGTYTVTVTNADGGTVTSTALLTVTGPTITAISPTSLAVPTTSGATATYNVNITGTGFEAGAYATFSDSGVTVNGLTVNSSTAAVLSLTVANGATTGAFNLTITNPDGSSAVSTASATGAGGLGIGAASFAAPTITSVISPTLTESNSGTVTIMGSGFGPAGSSDTVAFANTLGVNDTSLACSAAPTVISDTELTCLVHASSGVYSGLHSVTVSTHAGAVTSASFANGVTVSGGLLASSISPAAVVANAAATIVVSGSGFATGDKVVGVENNTTSIVLTNPTAETVTPNSSTTETVTLPAADVAASGKTVVVLSNSAGTYDTSFAVSVGGIVPSVTSISYTSDPTGTTGVGLGATSVPVTINGSGFLTGATITDSTQSAVTFSVVSITPTAISATVTVPATAMYESDSIKVTNANGGVSGTVSLVINKGPGGSSSTAASTGTLSVSPGSSVLAGATDTLTLSSAGGSFQTGVKVTSSSALLTVGAVTLNANGTLSVPVTAAAMSGTNNVTSTLTVTNPDGGVATTTITVNPGPSVTGTYYVAPSTSNKQVVISGTGFESGMTVKSSSTDFTVVLGGVTQPVAPSITTNAILVVSTDAAAVSGTSSTITFTNPDGGTVSFPLNGGTPAVTPPPVTTPGNPFTHGVSGVAIVGRTVVLTVLGGNFFAQPSITSSNPGTRVGVSGDSGTTLTIHVTTTGAGRKGWHTLTIQFANGKVCRANYLVK